MMDPDQIATDLADLAIGATEALAKQIIESFPELPNAEATEALIKVLLVRRIGPAVEEALLAIRTLLNLGD